MMTWSSAEAIDSVTSFFPEGLRGDASVSNARSLAERLPDIFSSFYLECRLGADEDQIDFLASLAPSRSVDLARIRAGAEAPPEEFRRDPAWLFTWNALRRWVDPERSWYRRLPFMWLEFDHLDTGVSTPRRPSLWVCADSSYSTAGRSAARSSHRDALDRCLDFLTPIVPPTLEASLSAGARRSMLACFEHLPPGGRIIHISPMFARDPVTIKLYGAVPKQHLVDYLRKIEWPGPVDVLQRIVLTFYTPQTADDVVYFDLSLRDDFLPCAGIAFSRRQLDGSDDARRVLLGLLEEHGLCDARKRVALEAWAGVSTMPRAARSSGAFVRRWFDTKIVLHPDRRISAKGYLGFAPVFSLF